jgi:hypothetical protein
MLDIVMLALRDRFLAASATVQLGWHGGWRWPLGH